MNYPCIGVWIAHDIHTRYIKNIRIYVVCDMLHTIIINEVRPKVRELRRRAEW